MYQFVITNQLGATLRTGPSTSGGEIRKAALGGDPLPIARLIFSQRQAFDETYIPAFLEAWKKNTVRGDVWLQLSEMQTYKNVPTTGYVAFRVGGTNYGVLVGAVEPPMPIPTDALEQYQRGYENGEINGSKSTLDKAIQYLAAERAKLGG